MNIAIILAGGIGHRMGQGIPKQYIMVGDRPVIAYCIERFAGSGMIDTFILAMDERWKEFVNPYVDGLNIPVWYSEPGETRQLTIYNALRCARERGADDEDIVIIHDAVRPNVSIHLIGVCLETCEKYDGAMPVLPVKDTIYQSVDGTSISSLLPRESLYAGQSPEAFRLGKYRKAHEALPYEEMLQVRGSSEIAFRKGMAIKLVPGEESNWKITVPEDMERFKLSLKS